MKVTDIMTHGVQTASPSDSVRQVAAAMAALDVGSLPVCDGQRMMGMITDRDIALRVVASGLSYETPVAEVMSANVEYCFVDDDVAEVADKMARHKIRRLPVVDRDKRLVGVVALGDLAREDKEKRSGHTLGEISEPGH